MRRFRRAIVVVCDGLGVGEAPDAAAFGDQGRDTLGHVLASQVVFQGWLTVARDRLRKPNGDEMDYTYVASSDAACLYSVHAFGQSSLAAFDLPRCLSETCNGTCGIACGK